MPEIKEWKTMDYVEDKDKLYKLDRATALFTNNIIKQSNHSFKRYNSTSHKFNFILRAIYYATIDIQKEGTKRVYGQLIHQKILENRNKYIIIYMQSLHKVRRYITINEKIKIKNMLEEYIPSIQSIYKALSKNEWLFFRYNNKNCSKYNVNLLVFNKDGEKVLKMLRNGYIF